MTEGLACASKGRGREIRVLGRLKGGSVSVAASPDSRKAQRQS